MIDPTRKLTGFKYAATLIGALAVALAPATANAQPSTTPTAAVPLHG